MPPGPYPACGARDRPCRPWPPPGCVKRPCLPAPACHSGRKAAGILNAGCPQPSGRSRCPVRGGTGPGRGDVSVAAGGGSSRVRAVRVPGGVTRCAARAARHRGCCPVPTYFPFVIESCSSGILCQSTFPDSPPAQQRVRPDAGCLMQAGGQPGKLAGLQPEQSSSAQATSGRYLKRAKRAPWPPWIVNEVSSVQVRELDRAICTVTGQLRAGCRAFLLVCRVRTIMSNRGGSDLPSCHR
jgi:hypothetical protein